MGGGGGGHGGPTESQPPCPITVLKQLFSRLFRVFGGPKWVARRSKRGEQHLFEHPKR